MSDKVEKYKPPQCSATSKRKGVRCTRPSIPGGKVCRYHGGGAPQVRRKAQERLNDLIDPDRALRTAAALAYADITQIYDDKFELRPLSEWPEAMRQAVKRLEPRMANVDPGDGASDRVLRVELHDKVKPLEMLFKHMGLLDEHVQHDGDFTFRWVK